MPQVYDDSGRKSHTYGFSGPGQILDVISVAGLFISLPLLFNRLWWRWRVGWPGVDDLLTLIAWILLFGLGLISVVAVNYGYGRPQYTLTRMEARKVQKLFYAYQIIYKLSINFSKLSVLTMYLRVFDQRDWFRKTTQALIVIVTCYMTCAIIANISNCIPISINWNTSGHHSGRCINILAFWYASAIYNILSESAMLLSVLVKIWTFGTPNLPPVFATRHKLSLSLLLGLGAFTILTAVLRMTSLRKSVMASDKTSGTLISTTWSSAEASLGVVVANLPMLRQLFRYSKWGRRVSGWFGSVGGTSRAPSAGAGMIGSPARNSCTTQVILTSPEPMIAAQAQLPAQFRKDNLPILLPPQTSCPEAQQFIHEKSSVQDFPSRIDIAETTFKQQLDGQGLPETSQGRDKTDHEAHEYLALHIERSLQHAAALGHVPANCSNMGLYSHSFPFTGIIDSRPELGSPTAPSMASTNIEAMSPTTVLPLVRTATESYDRGRYKHNPRTVDISGPGDAASKDTNSQILSGSTKVQRRMNINDNNE